MSSSTSIKLAKSEEVCLKELKQLVQGDENLKLFSSFLDDRFLLHFVRGKKYNTENAYESLKYHFHMKKVGDPDFYKSIDVKAVSNIILDVHCRLKSLDTHGRPVIIVQASRWDPSKRTANEVFQAVVTSFEELWNEECFEKNGIVVVYDMKGYNFSHFTAMSPSAFKRMISMFLNGYPFRVKGIHVVNVSYLSTLIMKAGKVILPSKMRKRFSIYTSESVKELHEHISPDILPTFLGGVLTEEEAFMDPHYLTDRIIAKEEYYTQLSL